jgi:hypothetical protein
VKQFAYWRDPLALAAAGLYALNRWVLVPAGAAGFWRNHFNDTLVVPAALPLVLWLHRRLGLRQHDHPPTPLEVGGHVAVWALLCEFAGPRLTSHGTADLWDVVAYAGGGALAWLWWRRQYTPAGAALR